MPVPDYSDPRPVYLQIADDLRVQIRAGKYGPGDRLPSNKELSERYGVATETLRQSLAVLHNEGLTATQSTRGTFVLKVPGEHAEGIGTAEERLEAALSELAALRERVARLHAELIELYHRVGQPYPYEGGEARGDTLNPGRQVG